MIPPSTIHAPSPTPSQLITILLPNLTLYSLLITFYVSRIKPYISLLHFLLSTFHLSHPMTLPRNNLILQLFPDTGEVRIVARDPNQ
jgi:hypothetical protein